MRMQKLLASIVALPLVAAPVHADWFFSEAEGAETAKPAPKKNAAVAPSKKTAIAAPVGADLTTATFGDWQLRCAMAASKEQPAARSCEVVQRIVQQGQTAPIAQLSFGRVAPSDPLYFTVLLPPNIALPSKVAVAAEKDASVDLAWTRCLPGGCFASVAMKDDVLKRWRAHDGGGQITFKMGDDRNRTFPFSLKGLPRALDALNK
jgi:invasion protein IalB